MLILSFISAADLLAVLAGYPLGVAPRDGEVVVGGRPGIIASAGL
jgi:hypothetical protein